MEEKKVEGPLMQEEEFKEFLEKNMYNSDGSLKLFLETYESVRKFKSVRRAIKRGHVSMRGAVYPKRPFGNTKTATDILKRQIYGKLKEKNKAV